MKVKENVLENKYLTYLRQTLAERFNEGELRTLCFDLRVEYADLPGEGRADKARELVAYLERRNCLPDLIITGQRLRPDVAWDQIPEEVPFLPRHAPFVGQMLHNLPPRSEFVGRWEEKARVHEALRSRSSLISIDGIGGVGKTALALEVAYECLHASTCEEPAGDIAAFKGFVWTTAKDRDLDLDALLDAIARTLEYPGIAQKQTEDKRTAISRLLQAGPYLLIVDNFETVADDDVWSFLLNLPEPSKALLTTREQKSRQVWAISLKDLTESEALTLIRSEGRRLGVQSLERGEDDVLFRLYRATGGTPLAIKWAVGQIKQRGQSLDTVVAALYNARGDVFHDIFTRSWGLLPAPARQVLMVMPLFATSASQEGIEAASDVHHLALDEALGQLVEMSLLDATDELDLARRRYGVHPLTRAFAAVKLHQEPDVQRAAQARLAAFFQALARQHGGIWQYKGVYQLEPELPNILAVIQWSWEGHLIQPGLDTFLNISGFMNIGGYWNVVLDLGRQAVALATEMGDELSVARLRVWPMGWIYRHRGNLDTAEVEMTQALTVLERLGDQMYTAHAKRNLGRIAQARGKIKQAEQMLEEALALYEALGDPTHIYWTTVNLADVALQQGDLDAARELSNRALPYARQAGRMEYSALCVLGSVARQCGDLQQAKGFWEEALAQMKRANHLDATADTSVKLAQIEIGVGQEQAARQRLGDALDAYRRLDIQHKVQEVGTLLARLSEGLPEKPSQAAAVAPSPTT